jgi:predicted RNA binding protein YcfA (HicA-like mRNA interferase family)
MAQRMIRDGKELEKIVKKAGYEVQECAGSHRKVIVPGQTPIVYHTHGETGKGLACQWTKRLKQLGLILFIGFIVGMSMAIYFATC